MKNKDNFIKEKEIELLDSIYIERKYIFDYYSTYELKNLFKIANYDINIINNYLDNNTKEELLEKINKKLFEHIQKNIDENKNEIKLKKIEKYELISKYYINLKNNININENERGEENEALSVWKYLLSLNINFIDIRDALRSYDKQSLFEKIKSEINQKLTKKGGKHDKILNNILIANELESSIIKKESKIFDLYKNKYEINDIYYFEQIELKEDINKQIKVNNQDNKYINFYEDFIRLPKNLKGVIFSFIDIFTLGKLSLCNKLLYNSIYKEYDLSINNAKIYVSAIFANSKLYELDKIKFKKEYKNKYFILFKNKPRIKFCGVYYSRVKSIREYSKFGSEIKNTFQIYYRILKFYPNGSVYSMTSPYYKIHKIKQGIKENLIEIKKGTFSINMKDEIIIKLTNNDEYIYSLGWSDFSIIKFGCNKNDPGIRDGIELKKYIMNDKYGEKHDIKLDENFPKRFRYRNIEILNNDIIINKYNYYETK